MLISSTQTIRDEIAVRLNEVESDNSDQYLTWIHQGIRDFKNAYPDNPFYMTSADRTLSSGTRIYTLPANFEKMYSVTYPGEDIKLKYLPPEQFDLLQPSATEAGSPMVYTIRFGGNSPQIEYYYSPGSSLTVHFNYLRSIETVSTGSSTPDVPTRYLEGLINYGVMQGLRRRGKWVEAREVANEIETLKQQTKDDLFRMANETFEIKSIRDFQKASVSEDPIINAFWN